MRKLNWNHERWRTRDRLLEYDFSIVPPHPHSGGIAIPYPQESERIPLTIPFITNVDLPSIYPWENITLSVLSHQLYQIALQNGYTGTEENFLEKFSNGNNEKEIMVGTISTFPVEGSAEILYLDRETDILYYFKSITEIVLPDAAEDIGAVIVEQTDTYTNLYIPVRALLLENTILDCGDVAEYID